MALKKPSAAERGLKRLNAETSEGVWHYDKKTRGVYNDKTHEKISRRQFDKNYGLLKEEGFKGFKQKADFNKKAGLTGFKKVPGFQGVKEKTFKTRQGMLNALNAMGGDNGYIFRVKLSGESADDRYKNNGRDSLDHAYAEALAASSPDVLYDDYSNYPDDAEKKFASVSHWTLVARKRS